MKDGKSGKEKLRLGSQLEAILVTDPNRWSVGRGRTEHRSCLLLSSGLQQERDDELSPLHSSAFKRPSADGGSFTNGSPSRFIVTRVFH